MLSISAERGLSTLPDNESHAAVAVHGLVEMAPAGPHLWGKLLQAGLCGVPGQAQNDQLTRVCVAAMQGKCSHRICVEPQVQP